MKKYIGTKEVEAIPMTLGEFINKSGRNPYRPIRLGIWNTFCTLMRL